MRFSTSLIPLATLFVFGACSDPNASDITFDPTSPDGKFDALDDRPLTLRPHGERNYTDSWREPDDNVSRVILSAEDKLVLSSTVWHFNALKPSGDTSCESDAECEGRSVCWEEMFCRDIQYDDTSIIHISVETRQFRPTLFAFHLNASFDPTVDPVMVDCPAGNIFHNVDVDFWAEEITVNSQTTYSFAECGLTMPRAIGAFDNVFFSAMAIPIPADDDGYWGEFEYDFTASAD